ncbi:MAG: C25 family cysteine peptidase, partial [candidate division WOR-3 bacterium]
MFLIFLIINFNIIKLKEPEFKIKDAGEFFYLELKNGKTSFSSPGEPDIPWEFIYIPLKDNEYADAYLKIISKKEINAQKPLIPFPYEEERPPFVRYEMNLDSYKKYPDENLKNFGIGSKRKEKCLVLAYTPFIVENGKVYFIEDAEIILNKKEKNKTFENKSHLEFFKRPFWIKIKTKEEGIYRITYKDLKEIGIEPSIYSYENFIIFSLFGERLNPSRDSLELLNPLPYIVPFVFKDKDNDGFFTNDDTILFYSPSVKKRRWDGSYFSFEENPFTDTTYFYLALEGGGGKLMKEIDVSPIYYEKIRDKAISYERYEKNLINLGKRGLRWIGEELSRTSYQNKKYSFNMFLRNIGNKRGKLKICIVVMRGNPNSIYTRYVLNKDTIAYVPYSPPNLNTPFTSIFSVNNLKENNNFEIIIGKENDYYDYLYLDYFEIEYEKFLKGDEIHAYDTTKGKVLYKIESDEKGYLIDVTDYKNPKFLKNFYFANDTIKFVLKNENIIEFFFSKKPKKPLEISIIQSLCELRDTLNQADYIIITHKKFESILKNYVNYRKNNLYFGDSLIKNPKIKIVTTDKIYNEFGFGSPEFVSIRNFLAYTFYFWRKPEPLYVLLAGNGNYDFKYNIGLNKNFVPSTEWGEVFDEISQGFYSYDLYYVQFDPPPYDPADMIIGRIPAENAYELDNYLKRVIEYEKEENNSLWRNRIIGVADDHLINQTAFINQVKGTLRFLPKSVDFKEIYTSFFLSKDGIRPLARVKLFEELNKGAFLAFFYGHGSDIQIFNQKIIYTPPDISNLNFKEKMPIFFFGTCKPSYFNKIERCVGEEMMIEPNSGIATIGSSTLIGIGTYKNVLESFLSILFDYKIHTLGECCFLSQVPRWYILLGDPTLILQIPPPLINLTYQGEIIDTVEKGLFFEFTDTLNLDGKVIVNLFGEPRFKIYPKFLPNVHCTTYVRPDDIFRGIFEIKNNIYNPKIPVPLYLSEDSFGKLLLYYGRKGRGIVGVIDSIYFKESAAGIELDKIPPIIKIFYLGQEIKDSMRIRKNDEIEIEIFDKNGVLIYGNERIKLKLEEEYDLTDYYICENDDPRKGRIKFKIPENITSGYKNLTVSAYDNFYNLGIITKIIYIEEEEKISIRCLPFPNPSKDKVYFGIETNEDGKIDLKIYTLRGRLIYEKSGIYINKGFNKIEWNGKDRDGNFVSNGIYIYKIEFENLEKNYKKTIK